MLKVGITGGIGSGKSAASERIKELGAYVFDADKEAKQILAKDKKIQEDLRNEFGTDVMDADNSINPKKLAKIAFSNEENQSILNAIVHPYVFDTIDERYYQVNERDDIPLFVVDAALVYESGLYLHLDYVVVVSAQYGTRINRSLNRGTLTREDIQKRMDLQLPEESKVQMADFVIDNNGDSDHLFRQVDEIYQEII
ncbi:MAG: dephospho-CoA kinase [Candidatus Marinimicrobia bacterium]|nr:dephospho-CoA kinase [Candidatus Neomarinimicrobiota bacterium]|tara:strand:+ start:2348 stop:2941 length:594 start_codon:yes stop_codon:yes gene_type:complete